MREHSKKSLPSKLATSQIAHQPTMFQCVPRGIYTLQIPRFFFQVFSVQFSRSVVSNSLRAHESSTPGLPVHHQLLELYIESVMPSSHLILCRPLLLPLPIPPSIRVFSNESTLHMRWPKYWSFSFRISSSNEHLGLISLQSKELSRVFSNITVQKHQFFAAQLSSQSNSHIYT